MKKVTRNKYKSKKITKCGCFVKYQGKPVKLAETKAVSPNFGFSDLPLHLTSGSAYGSSTIKNPKRGIQ